MATISFDYDYTLWDAEQDCFIEETVNRMRQHIAIGDRVIIVTARIQVWADEAKVDIERMMGMTFEVFSCPGTYDPVRGGTEGRNKSDVLIAEGATVHFDDIPNDSSLFMAREAGIDVRMPPATSANRSRGMY